MDPWDKLFRLLLPQHGTATNDENIKELRGAGGGDAQRYETTGIGEEQKKNPKNYRKIYFLKIITF